MITITPNGNIKLYSGIRLDNTYQNALSFTSAAARDAYFLENNPYLIGSWEKVTYQRVTSGQCDVEIPIGSVYTANYMAFQNKGFSNRWFYAFVTNVEYVNNITTRIYYEIDVLTTFYFDWNYLPSFVEREHTATDVIGDNVVPENINYGELVAFNRMNYYLGNWDICVAVATLTGQGEAFTTKIGNLVNGVQLIHFNVGNAYRAFQSFLNTLSGEQDQIVSIFMYPNTLISSENDPDYDHTSIIYNVSQGVAPVMPQNINGYVPKNKKLFTFPYCYLAVDNGTITNNYRWEWFSQLPNLTKYTFVIRGAMCPGGTIYAAPLGYKGLTTYGSGQGLDRYIPCFDERIELPPLPQVAYPIDSYRAWLAQTESSRKNKFINSVAGGAASGAASGAATGTMIYPGIGTAIGAVAGGLIGGASAAVGAKISDDQAKAEAADMKNKAAGGGNGTLEIVDDKYGLTFKSMGLNPSDAKIVDDYFTLFGYAINAIKTPAIRTRPHWNYIKTCGLNMAAQNVPADYVRKIKAIHDQGVTYWKVHDEIGNYALDNTV